MTFLDAVGKKLIGKIHKPTMISALKDDIDEHHNFIQYYQKKIQAHGFEIQELEQKIKDLQKND